MKIAVIVSTFNWPEALQLVLTSLLQQTILPDEIIIADDGSDEATRHTINLFRKKFPIPVRHFWQTRNGFQKTLIVNKAVAATRCDYIIQIDGDIIAHPHFVEDHMDAAEKGFYVRGSRTLLDKYTTLEFLHQNRSRKIFPFSSGIKNRLNSIHHRSLSQMFIKYKRESGNVHGCNLAYWRKDFVAANGYDNRFKGWGHEDIELAARLVNAGVLQKKIKFTAVCYKLPHD